MKNIFTFKKLILLAVILCCFSFAHGAFAADRYWVGGTGNWTASNTANWSSTSGGSSGASVPTSADNCIFDTNSNTSDTAYTVTLLTDTANCLDFTMDGPGSGANITWAGSVALNIYGSMNLIGGSTDITRSFSGAITFKATSGTKTITTNGLSLGSTVTFDGVGGTWQLNDTFTGGGQCVLTNGTWNTNNQTVNCNAFSSSNGNTRTLTLGSSTFNLVSSGTAWDTTTITGFTFNAGTSNITKTFSTVGTINGGGLTFYDFTITVGSSTFTFTGSNTFHNLTLNGGNNKTGLVSMSGNQTVTNTLTVAGNSTTNRVLIASNTIGTARTFALSGASTSLTNVDFTDITFTGSPLQSGSSIGDCLGNTGITTTSPATRYWVASGSASWSSTSSWSASDGGASGASVPLCHDTVNFTSNSGSGTRTVTVDMPRIGADVDLSAISSGAVTLTNSVANTVYGSLKLASTTSPSGTNTTTLSARGIEVLTNAGRTFTQAITIDAVGGTYTLQDAIITNGALTLTNGTFDGNGFAVTALSFSSSNSNTRTLTMGAGTWTLTGNATTIWTTSTATNMTLSKSSSPVVSNYSGSTGTRTITGSTALGMNNPDFNVTAGTDTFQTTGGFGSINYTGFSGSGDLDNGTSTCYGGFTFSSGMSIVSSGNTFYFGATSGTQTITSNGKTIDQPITFDGVGGTWQLGDAMTVGSTRTVTITNGTLNTSSSNYAFTTGLLNIGSSGVFTSNSSVVTLNGTSGTLFTRSGTLTAVGSTSEWHVTSASGTPVLLSAATTFHILKINSAATVINLGANLTTDNNSGNKLWIASGVLNQEARTITAGTAGTLQVDSGGTLCLGGTSSTTSATCDSGATQTTAQAMPSFTTYTFDASSTIRYLSNAATTISSTPTYGNLIFKPVMTIGRTYTLGGAMTINGDFEIHGTSSSCSLTLTVNAGGDITVASGKTTTITRTGACLSTFDLRPSSTNYNLSTGAINIATGGTLDLTSAGSTITLTGTSGTLFTKAGTFTITSGTPTVSVTSASGTPTLLSATTTFYNLTINSGATVINQGNFAPTINNNLTITSGVYNASGASITGPGAGAGTLTIGATGTLCLGGTTASTTATCNSGSSDTTTRSMPTFQTYTFDSASTVSYLSNADTTVSNTPTYGNLKLIPVLVSTSRVYTAGGALNINGDFTITADESGGVTPSLTVNSAGTITVASSKTTTISILNSATAILDLRPSTTDYNLSTGLINIASGGTLDAGSSASTITLTGTSGTLWTQNGTFTIDSGTPTVTMSGIGTATATAGTAPTFYNFNSSGTGTKTLGTNITVNNVFNISAGTLDASSYTITLAGTTGTPFVVSGSFTPSTGTVTYTGDYGSGNTNITSITYNNLTLNNGSETYILAGDTTVSGVLTISAGILDASSRTLTLSGTTGTPFVNSGTFTASTSTVSYTGNYGSGNTNVVATTYNNLTLNNGSETYILAGNTTVSGVLTISAGVLDASSRTLTLAGTTGTPFVNSGTFTPSTSTVSYTGNNTGGNTTITNTTYNNLTVNNASETYVLGANITIPGTLTVTAGTFSPGSYTINLSGTGTVLSNSGTFTGGSSIINITDTSASAKTFGGGGGTFGTVNFVAGNGGGSYTISGSNTFGAFNDVNNSAHTINFTAGTTQTVTSWNVKGSSGNIVTLQSTSAGSTWYLVPSPGSVGLGRFESDYLSIKDSTATNGWVYKKTLVIDNAVVSNTDQTDFPLLVYLSSDADLASHAQADGDDIKFTDSLGNQLDHEISIFNSSTGQLEAWVRIPTLSASTDTTLYMYYGNAGASNQQDATGTWDTNFEGIWHFGNGTSLSAEDSTNVNDGTVVGSPTATTGKVGGGVNSFSANNYINLADTSSLNITGSITISSWINMAATNTLSVLLGGYQNSGSYPGYGFGVSVPTASTRSVSYYTVGTGWKNSNSSVLSNSTWHYISVTDNGSTRTFYVDGVAQGTATAGNSNSYAGTRVIGATETHTAPFPGTADELRVSSSLRSADWIKTEYNNQNSPSTYQTLSQETFAGNFVAIYAGASSTSVSNNVGWIFQTISRSGGSGGVEASATPVGQGTGGDQSGEECTENCTVTPVGGGGQGGGGGDVGWFQRIKKYLLANVIFAFDF